MIPAFFIALLAVIIALIGGTKKNYNHWLLVSFAILTVFLCLGYYWGSDVERYEQRFLYYADSGITAFDFSEYDYLSRSEFGFVFINLICKPLGYWGMRAVLFFLENAIIYYFIINHVDKKWYWLAVFVYVFNPYFWVLSSSMMRQWLAICLCLLSVEFLLRGKKLFYFITILIASTIHLTALVCLLYLPIYYIAKSRSYNIVFTFLLVLFYFTFVLFFRDYLILFLNTEDIYTAYTDVTTGVGISSIARLLLYIYILYVAIKQQFKDRLLNWIVVLYALTLPLLSYSQLVSRIGLFFTSSTIATYPIFISQAKVGGLFKKALLVLVCSYLLYLFYVFFTGPTFYSSYYHYNTLPFFN